MLELLPLLYAGAAGGALSIVATAAFLKARANARVRALERMARAAKAYQALDNDEDMVERAARIAREQALLGEVKRAVADLK